MDTYNSLYSPGCVLNEEIARQVFEILPEDGPVMIIMSRQGNCWPSCSEGFAKLGISDGFLKELCAKVDDGDEPVITQANDFSIVAGQLVTDHTNCGYVIIALPQYSPESTLANIGLIEMLLNQVGLIARLIEKSNLLYERQMRQFNGYKHAESGALN